MGTKSASSFLAGLRGTLREFLKSVADMFARGFKF